MLVHHKPPQPGTDPIENYLNHLQLGQKILDRLQRMARWAFHASVPPFLQPLLKNKTSAKCLPMRAAPQGR